MESSAEEFLKTLDKTRLSPRGYYRLLKVARTIADLEEASEEAPTLQGGRGPDRNVGKKVSTEHLAEAFSYRLREEI